MSANAATAKLSVLVTPDTKRRLQDEARAKRITVGELVRQRLSGEPDDDERAFKEALTAVGNRAEALAAKLDATHAAVEQDRANWPEREAEIRRRTLASISAAERASLQRFLLPVTREARS